MRPPRAAPPAPLGTALGVALGVTLGVTLGAAPAAARAQSPADVGRAVRVRCEGVYTEARVTAVRGNRYQVAGCRSEDWVTADRLKTTDFGDFRPAGTPEPAAAVADRRAVTGSAADVGRAVRVRYEGVYVPARIVAVAGDARYQVRYDETPYRGSPVEWVEGWRLALPDYGAFRPANAVVSAPPAGSYVCYHWVSASGRLGDGQLVRSGVVFALGAGGTYTNTGTRGRYAFAPATGRVEFRGGVMDGRAGVYNGSQQRPSIELFGSGGPATAPGSERKVASCERQG